MIAVIVKGFAGHKPGDLVDTAGWRNEHTMLRSRHIRPAAQSELDAHKRGARSIIVEKSAKAKA